VLVRFIRTPDRTVGAVISLVSALIALLLIPRRRTGISTVD